jgi:hypothetical protein
MDCGALRHSISREIALSADYVPFLRFSPFALLCPYFHGLHGCRHVALAHGAVMMLEHCSTSRVDLRSKYFDMGQGACG